MCVTCYVQLDGYYVKTYVPATAPLSASTRSFQKGTGRVEAICAASTSSSTELVWRLCSCNSIIVGILERLPKTGRVAPPHALVYAQLDSPPHAQMGDATTVRVVLSCARHLLYQTAMWLLWHVVRLPRCHSPVEMKQHRATNHRIYSLSPGVFHMFRSEKRRQFLPMGCSKYAALEATTVSLWRVLENHTYVDWRRKGEGRHRSIASTTFAHM